MLLVQPDRVVPRHELAFEDVVRLLAPALDLYVPDLVQDYRELDLRRRVLLRHVYLVERRIAQAVVLPQLGVDKQLYAEALAIIGYERIYFRLSHFRRTALSPGLLYYLRFQRIIRETAKKRQSQHILPIFFHWSLSVSGIGFIEIIVPLKSGLM